MDRALLHHRWIIAPGFMKNRFLKIRKENPELNFHVADREELFRRLCFSFDDRAKIFLHRKGILYENAEEILDSLRFLKKGVSEKADELIALREEMDREGLLIRDPYFSSFFSKQEALVIGYESDDPELSQLLKMTSVSVRYLDREIPCGGTVYEFETLEEEMRYLFERIYLWIEAGIPTDRIKVVTRDETYIRALKKYQSFHSLKFSFPSGTSFFQSDDFALLRDFLATTVPDQAFDLASDRMRDEEGFASLRETYLRVKEYLKAEEAIAYLSFVARSIPYREESYEGVISVCDLSQCGEEDYVLVPGFSLNVYPGVFRDEDYLSDKEKALMGRKTSFEMQKEEERNFFFKNGPLKHLEFSYAKTNDKEVYYPSHLAERGGMKLTSYPFSDRLFSRGSFSLFMGKVFDDYEQFSYLSPHLDSCSREEISYRKYTHAYRKIPGKEDGVLRLSFTGLQTYFECGFKYYLTYILKADTFEDSIYSKVGSIVHTLFEYEVKGKEISFEEATDRQELTAREKTLISCLKEQTENSLNHFRKWREATSLKYLISEAEQFTYPISETAVLEGKIDLIATDEKRYIIVDYKTKEFKFEAKKVPFGFSLQLPLYYLLTQGEDSPYSERELIGLYIHTVLSKDFYSGTTDYLLLNGITLKESGYEAVEGNDNFVKKNNKRKVAFGEKEFDDLIAETRELLSRASEAIRDRAFPIGPKIWGKSNLSCDHCSFQDVCYHDYRDNVYLKPEVEK